MKKLSKFHNVFIWNCLTFWNILFCSRLLTPSIRQKANLEQMIRGTRFLEKDGIDNLAKEQESTKSSSPWNSIARVLTWWHYWNAVWMFKKGASIVMGIVKWYKRTCDKVNWTTFAKETLRFELTLNLFENCHIFVFICSSF